MAFPFTSSHQALSSLSIDGIEIRQDAEGRFSLNDMHKASGGLKRHNPSYWLENQQTQELIEEIRKSLNSCDTGIPVSPQINGLEPVVTIKGGHGLQGTFVVCELVYSYAMWISPAFHLKVIRTFDAVVTGRAYYNPANPVQPPPQPAAQFPLFLTPEQFTASFHETIRDSVYKAFRGSSRGLIRAEVNKALADQQEAMQDLIEQAVRDGVNATFTTIGEAAHGQQAQPVRPTPIPPGQIEEGRYAVQRAQARERHHQDLRVEAVSGGTWKGYLRRHNIGRLFTREERQTLKAEFYQLQQSCRPLTA